MPQEPTLTPRAASEAEPSIPVLAEPRRLVRPLDRAQVAGVAAGLGDHLGISPRALRALFAVATAWQLAGVVAYLVLWLVIPPASAPASAPGVDAATRQGMRTGEAARQAPGRDVGEIVALGLVAVGGLWLVQLLGWGGEPRWLAVTGLVTASATLVWWQADRAQASLPDASHGPAGWLRPLVAHWTTVFAHAVALLAMGAAIALALLWLPSLGTVGTLVAGLGLAGAGVALLAAPWVLRARRALLRAREEKLLSDARADMAAHLHDSVLQTLALIQRQASDPRRVARLARRQERELREWLYGVAEEDDTLRGALLEAALEVEDDFPVSVECVTVGDDVLLTPGLRELVKAAREAMVNAAKHSGEPLVDVYAEVGEDVVEVFVRDRGDGFDIDEVAEDRMGVRGSILERMARHHGVARIRSSAERGTEVILEMRR
ncbi:MAG: PspC domain-containing protein [Propioniciclava sp.]|uniref:PspC domain-containing protein n=1 Tax=Propioniciclava sp. TaxID=2038686 RepID=UPI0039E41BDC